MTETVVTKDEALKLALEALEENEVNARDYCFTPAYEGAKRRRKQAITAIKKALAQPAQEPFDTHASPGQAVDTHLRKPAQKPVAWGVFEGNLHDLFLTQAEAQEMAELKGNHAKVQPLYTTPPQRPWVELTAADRKEIERQSVYVEGAVRMTEAKLKEKNT